ncbi:P450-derived glycosyltransferase activator [Streptosporangium sp. LJ11]|uniref:cytochrome P450 family protein n=1 Tax=Streptosporangium sp. LJ11 TaxID=3436927 RepID=UPI003F7AAAD6
MANGTTDKPLADTMSDSELSYVLLLAHGAQWIAGVRGDPYALLLRGAGDDPHDLGRRMRDLGPLYRSHAAAWVTAHHELAAAALRDPRLSPEHAAAREPDDRRAEEERILPFALPGPALLLPLGRASLALDGPGYERLRRLTGSALGEAALDRAHGRTADLCAARLRALGDDFDLREDFARPVAADAVGALLGLPASGSERFRALCSGTAGALDATVCPPLLAEARRITEAIGGMRELLDAAAGPGGVSGGLAGELAAAAARANSPEDDAPAACASLAVVGTEMTANLICEAMAALLDHPQEWALVRDDPARAAAAIEETMRYAPPARLHRLYAHQDVELGGRAVRAGDELVVAAEAAGRDPAAHDEPGRFSVGRTGARALPDGPLTGLAGPPARRLAAAAVGALAARLPGIRRTGPVVRRPRSPVTRAVLRLPVAIR